MDVVARGFGHRDAHTHVAPLPAQSDGAEVEMIDCDGLLGQVRGSPDAILRDLAASKQKRSPQGYAATNCAGQRCDDSHGPRWLERLRPGSGFSRSSAVCDPRNGPMNLLPFDDAFSLLESAQASLHSMSLLNHRDEVAGLRGHRSPPALTTENTSPRRE